MNFPENKSVLEPLKFEQFHLEYNHVIPIDINTVSNSYH